MTIKSQLLSCFPELIHAVSTRIGGVSPEPYGMNLSFNVGDHPENVMRNRELFFGSLKIPLNRLAIPGQIHSATVKCAFTSGNFPSCDALITNKKGIFLIVTIADCLPIFLYDPIARAIGLVHVGWKGSQKSIVSNVIQKMKNELNVTPSNMVAYVGPGAGVCCYEVGSDVAGKFEEQFIRQNNGRHYLDLKFKNMQQLIDSGVSKERIEISDYCTICNPKLFHSYRREGKTSGRMVAVIGMIG